MERLRALQAAHPDTIGDIRGRGLFIGIDVVQSAAGKAPAPAVAKWVKEQARLQRVLLSCDGPYEQVRGCAPRGGPQASFVCRSLTDASVFKAALKAAQTPPARRPR